jgi:polysaccharide pyruvyl transferase WcaK-like protein
VRLHLGHHFYGAGNLGDDFMLAGFLAGLRATGANFTLGTSIPFALEPQSRRFPQIDWQPYSLAVREASIADCSAWVGIGGAPFQSAQSRWFIDHLIEDAALCRKHGKPMFFLGVGVQTEAELARPEICELCAQAARIWTRDNASAERLTGLAQTTKVNAAADLAHLFFREFPPPAAALGRITLTPNFDYASWPGEQATLSALDDLPVTDRVWLAQETRDLPGAERTLFAALPDKLRARWRLVTPDEPGTPLESVLQRWPSGEWTVTARFHAAIAGAWAGSKVVVIETNEKLRGIARLLRVPTIAADCSEAAVRQALIEAKPVARPAEAADLAATAVAQFATAVSSL